LYVERPREETEEGPEGYYGGPLGRDIAADWEQGGALVTREDPVFSGVASFG